ncbi:MAG: outer membrane protein assembly factor BamD [Phycisphaerae bacterium]|nr:outer membrane protein assembly factor BamD [Phycisphaerae bacterium]
MSRLLLALLVAAGIGLWTVSAGAQDGHFADEAEDEVVDAQEPAGQDMEWVDGQWVPAAPRDFSTPEGMLAWIRQYADRRQNALVISTAKRFLEQHPGGSRAEEAMLLAGEAELRRGRYWQAYGWFERQLNAYPAGRFSARGLERQHEVGVAFLAGKRRIVWGFLPLPARTEGIDILLRIVDRAPGSAIGEKSMMAVAEHYFDRRDYLLAVGAYDRYQELFKGSPRLAFAVYRAALSTLGTFRGTVRDGTPLIDAEQRFGMFVRRFPRDAQAAEAGKIIATIRDLRGQKSFETGVYYRDVGRAEAAAFYFDRTADAFSDTVWGERAAAQRRALGDVQRPRPVGMAIPAPGLPVQAPERQDEPDTPTQRIEEIEQAPQEEQP